MALIVNDRGVIVPTAEKISMKYYGSPDHPGAKAMIGRSKMPDTVVIAINPKFFSTWDFSKVQ